MTAAQIAAIRGVLKPQNRYPVPSAFCISQCACALNQMANLGPVSNTNWWFSAVRRSEAGYFPSAFATDRLFYHFGMRLGRRIHGAAHGVIHALLRLFGAVLVRVRVLCHVAHHIGTNGGGKDSRPRPAVP